jgi:hypothetical protein
MRHRGGRDKREHSIPCFFEVDGFKPQRAKIPLILTNKKKKKGGEIKERQQEEERHNKTKQTRFIFSREVRSLSVSGGAKKKAEREAWRVMGRGIGNEEEEEDEDRDEEEVEEDEVEEEVVVVVEREEEGEGEEESRKSISAC